MGRNNKISSESKKHYTKEELEKKQQAEQRLKELAASIDEESDAPAYLKEIALQEWLRIIPIINESGLPHNSLDINALGMYCQYYALYVELNEDVFRRGIMITQTDSKGNEVTKVNPAYKAMNEASQQMQKIAASMGLTLNSRLQILGNDNSSEKEDDPFANI